MTFETEEGYMRACKFNKILKGAKEDEPGWKLKHFLETSKHSTKFVEASEPSDIIWENRSFTKRQRRCKRAVVFLVVFTALILSFFIIFYGTKLQVQVQKMFPY